MHMNVEDPLVLFYVCLQVSQSEAFEETSDNPQQCGHFSMRDLWSQVQDQDKKSHRALGLVPDQPAQVGRPVQDQRILVQQGGQSEEYCDTLCDEAEACSGSKTFHDG